MKIERPNILLILTDQQSFRMLGCAGNPYLSTPAMDSLAAEGVRFDRAYCTNPVCAASRFSLLTGHMPSAIGMMSNALVHIRSIPDSIKKNGLGFRLREAGYDVAYAGKVHLPRMSAADVGFEYVCQDERELLAEFGAGYLAQKRQRPFCLVVSFINPHDVCYMALRDSEVQIAQDRGFLQNAAVQLNTLDAALARPPGVDDAAFFERHCPPLPANFEPQEGEAGAIDVLLDQRPFRREARRRWSEQRWREHRWAYARLTELVDRQVGRVLEGLRASGQADQTLVVMTSDHGDMDAAHRLEGKSTLYDEAARIPLIIRPPGGARAGRVDRTHLVSNGLDLLPTLCDWAGAPGAGAEAGDGAGAGRSLRRLVESEDAGPWRQSVGIECAIGRCVVTERFKYCKYDLGKNDEQLMDLVADPLEQRNALHDPQKDGEVQRLRAVFEETFGPGRRSGEDAMRAAISA